MIGKTVSHYRITRELGAGGMGVVYEAVDTKLDRTVALKFLSPASTDDPDAKARFIHEAKAASALDHPNVCSVFDIGETDDGRLFLAMARYEGETLSERIARGPLPWDEAVEISRQVAEGLAKAHERDIVHRDIKPANLYLTSDGLVKILDFGLAKLTGVTHLTRTGTTLGTGHYMSPEQAGGRETDRRSDLWSLGATLYEMVTGQVPFGGEYPQAVLYAIQNREPEPVTGLRSGVPLELDRIIGKCLAKDRDERYQDTDDLLADLLHLKRNTSAGPTQTLAQAPVRRPRRWPWIIGSVAAVLLAALMATDLMVPDKDPGAIPVLAVLPFENLGNPSDAYFADGITDEILTKLSVLRGIGVIARESSFLFRGDETSIEVIGDRLGADYLLVGTIRWQAGAEGTSKVRITPKLVSVASGQSIWADAYEEDLEEIFQVQARIGLNIIRALGVTLLDDQDAEFHAQPTADLGSYLDFLRARELLLRAPDGVRFAAADSLLDLVLDKDPGFALAHAWSSMLNSDMHHYELDRNTERLERSREGWEKALSLDPHLPEAYLAQGRYFYYANRDYAKALSAFEEVLVRRPNDWLAIHYIGVIKKRQGRFDEALDWYQKAHDRNPASHKGLLETAVVLRFVGREEEAIRTFDRLLTLWPDEGTPYRSYCLSLMTLDGNTARARPVMERAIKNCGMKGNERLWFQVLVSERKFQDAFAVAGTPLMRAELYFYLGDRDRMLASADSARIDLAKKSAREPEDHLWHLRLGTALAYLGTSDKALREAEMGRALMSPDKDAMDGPVVLHQIARILLLAGDIDGALDTIETALEASDELSVQILRQHPFWDSLRGNPRFEKLIAAD